MKIAVIGAGAVGSATAFALIFSGVAHKVVLVDINTAKAEAEARLKAEAEARAAGGATNSNTDQMKSDADEIQRIGNNVLSTVQKWSSSTTTLLKSANAYVYQYSNNTGWERDTVMKNGRTK